LHNKKLSMHHNTLFIRTYFTIPVMFATIFALALLTIQPLAAAPSPQNISQLKSLEQKITGVVQKVLPATISLFSAKSGASGSGVVVSKDGLILTAGHVVRGSDQMTVVFPNGKQATGKVLGANYTRDTAMIQIMDPKPTFGWPHAGIGKSQKLDSGDLVIALGHAGGYDPVRTPPVRFGRVIAQGQDHFLSTDCTLIGGDSGGPLFDLNGSVVGIHSSIGESLSSNNHAGITGVLQDWKKLEKGETWGRLGGSSLLDNPDAPVIGIITGRLTKSGISSGISIRHVFEGGPAGKAGLRAGDIINNINDKNIPDLRTLHIVIAQHEPGETITIRLIRGQNRLTRKLTLGRRGDIIPDENR
jgi:serine protease Do